MMCVSVLGCEDLVVGWLDVYSRSRNPFWGMLYR
jgi:hypothetical protein